MKSKINVSLCSALSYAAGILLTGYLAGCQTGKKASAYPQGVILNDGPGLEMIQAVTDEFLQAWNKRDATACANTYSKDAIFMPQGQQSVQGRENIRTFFANSEWEVKEETEMKINEKVEEVIYFGDWAVMRGLGQIAEMEPDSSMDVYSFKWVMLSKKNEGGAWESVWDIFNDN